jgi:hypothetical protein
MRPAWFLLLLVLAEPAPAQTGDEIDARVEQRIAEARAKFGAPAPRRRCESDSSDDDAIVVCAPDRGEDQRVPSTAETDPNSLAARLYLDNGVPRAPQLDRGSCKGQAGCIVGGWAPPPVYYIDLRAIPEAPEGSDADKIAKGEMPAP